MAGSAAFAPDFGHMLPIGTDRLAAFAAGFACFLRRKLVSVPGIVSGLTAFARDFALFLLVHRSETAIQARVPLSVDLIAHGDPPDCDFRGEHLSPPVAGLRGRAQGMPAATGT
jgi:hypothetical protein